MGMYTEFVLDINLKTNIDPSTIDILEYMSGYKIDQPENLPNAELFRAYRWPYMLQLSGSIFDTNYRRPTLEYIDELKCYRLSICSSIKNYDFEIEKFLVWIVSHSNSFGLVGYTKYEEATDAIPIYFYYGKVSHSGLLLTQDCDIDNTFWSACAKTTN